MPELFSSELQDMTPGEDSRKVRESVDKLTKAVEGLMNIFKTASADIHAEAESELGKKLVVMIRQNGEIAKALVMLLEVQREHLKRSSRNVVRRQTPNVSLVSRVEPGIAAPQQAPPPPQPVNIPQGQYELSDELLDLPEFENDKG